jgi:hypothetical protein
LSSPFPNSSMVSKHVEIDLQFIGERVAVGDICVLYVPTTSQFTDIFTKGLPSSMFLEFHSPTSSPKGCPPQCF